MFTNANVTHALTFDRGAEGGGRSALDPVSIASTANPNGTKNAIESPNKESSILRRRLVLSMSLYLSIPFCRWIHEAHFPYGEASTLLPSYMKFSDKDSLMMYALSLPRKDHVVIDCTYLVKLLELALPEQDLRTYTARFILDLNLPGNTMYISTNINDVWLTPQAYPPKVY